MKVYIIDDDAKDTELASELLVKKYPDIEIVCENNPLDAQKYLLTGPHFDLILLDMQMSYCDGLEMLKFIDEHAIKIPVIVYSNFLSNYKTKIDRNKIATFLDKKKMHSENSDLVEFFMFMNTIKSCVLLTSEMNKYMEKKKERKTEFYENLKKIRDDLSTLSL